MLACIAWHRYRTAARSRVLAMCIAAAALALGVSTAMTVRSGAATGLIQASGTQLTLNGQPFRFTGFNDYVLPSTSPGFQCGGAQTDAYRDHVMQEAHDQAGSTVMKLYNVK